MWLHFTKLHTETSYDVVHIYDGNNTNAPELGIISGHVLPGNNITSSGNTVYVHFKSDYAQRFTGFTIRYSAFGGKFNIVIKVILFLKKDVTKPKRYGSGYGCLSCLNYNLVFIVSLRFRNLSSVFVNINTLLVYAEFVPVI